VKTCHAHCLTHPLSAPLRFKEAVDGFLEELVVRRELSDNFCE